MAGTNKGEYSRGDDLEQNMGMRPFYVRQLIQNLLLQAPAEEKVGRRWILELHCFSKQNAPVCEGLGVEHVAISGQTERIRGKDYPPDLLQDLALVFTELERPIEFLVDRALKHLHARQKRRPEPRVGTNARCTRQGLILVTAAPRCTTYANMSGCNKAQNFFVSREPDTNKPCQGGKGVMALVDDTANARMMAEFANLPKMRCVPAAPVLATVRAPAAPVAGTPPTPATVSSAKSGSTAERRAKRRRLAYTVATRQLTDNARELEADAARALQQARRRRVRQWLSTRPQVEALLGEWHDVNPERCTSGTYGVQIGTEDEAVDVRDGDLVVKIFCGLAKPPQVRYGGVAYVSA